MQAINKLIGAGGTYNWNSTSAYVSGIGVKRNFYAVEFNADNTIDELEISEADALADYGFTAGDAILAGTVIFCESGKAFNKLTTGSAAQVTLYRV